MAKEPTTVRLNEVARRHLDELTASGETQTSVMERAITALWQSEIAKPPAVIGWLRLDRWGELDERDEPSDAYATCACGEPIDPANAWVQVVADGRVLGPVCEGCATSA